MNTPKKPVANTPADVLEKVRELFHALIAHDGYGDMRIEVRILKRDKKEVIVHCGKQYRYVIEKECHLPG